jgi:transposase-like protein
MECIHYKVREDGRILSRAAYVVMGVTVDGYKEIHQAVFPKAEIQRCVIHMLRNSFKYVSYKDLKKFSSDFKAVYNALNEAAALSDWKA